MSIVIELTKKTKKNNTECGTRRASHFQENCVSIQEILRRRNRSKEEMDSIEEEREREFFFSCFFLFVEVSGGVLAIKKTNKKGVE